MNQLTAFILSSLLFSMAFLPSSALASRQIDSADKLNLLNEATGGSSSGASSSFEARMNAIMDTTASPDRAYIAGEDALAREQAAITQKEEALVESKRIEELNPARYNPKKNFDNTKISDADTSKDLKTNATENAYLKERSDIQQDFEKRLEKEKKELTAQASRTTSAAPKETLRADLANNPFYLKKSASPGKDSFESRRTLYISRVSAATGVSPEESAEIVSRASNSEDLILILMKEFGISYGEASNAVS